MNYFQLNVSHQCLYIMNPVCLQKTIKYISSFTSAVFDLQELKTAQYIWFPSCIMHVTDVVM